MGIIIKTDLEFGTEYEDRVSGFKGKCTGVVQHQYGCIRALLQPAVDKDGKHPEGVWFDEPQLIESRTDKPGGPMPAPQRRRDP